MNLEDKINKTNLYKQQEEAEQNALKQLKKYIHNNEVTIKEVAKRIDRSYHYMVNILNGKKEMTIEMAVTLWKAGIYQPNTVLKVKV